MFTFIHSLNVKGQETITKTTGRDAFGDSVILFDLKYLINDIFILIFH